MPESGNVPVQGTAGRLRAAGAAGRQEHPVSQQRRRHVHRCLARNPGILENAGDVRAGGAGRRLRQRRLARYLCRERLHLLGALQEQSRRHIHRYRDRGRRGVQRRRQTAGGHGRLGRRLRLRRQLRHRQNQFRGRHLEPLSQRREELLRGHDVSGGSRNATRDSWAGARCCWTSTTTAGPTSCSAMATFIPRCSESSSRVRLSPAQGAVSQPGQRAIRRRLRDGGPGIAEKVPGARLALGDFDNDGDVDVVVNCVNDVPQLLRCDSTLKNNWIKIKTRRHEIEPQRQSARAIVLHDGQPQADGRSPQRRQLHVAERSAGALRLGQADKADIEIRWPSGQVDQSRQGCPRTAFTPSWKARASGRERGATSSPALPGLLRAATQSQERPDAVRGHRRSGGSRSPGRVRWCEVEEVHPRDQRLRHRFLRLRQRRLAGYLRPRRFPDRGRAARARPTAYTRTIATARSPT